MKDNRIETSNKEPIIWHPILFGIISLVIANGFWFYNAVNTGNWWFNGLSLESIGFLVFGIVGFYLVVLRNTSEMLK